MKFTETFLDVNGEFYPEKFDIIAKDRLSPEVAKQKMDYFMSWSTYYLQLICVFDLISNFVFISDMNHKVMDETTAIKIEVQQR